MQSIVTFWKIFTVADLTSSRMTFSVISLASHFHPHSFTV